MCAVLGEPRHSFYEAATLSQREGAELQIGQRIESVFRRHRRRYGYRSLAKELGDQGVVCAPATIDRIMARAACARSNPKTFAPRTSDGRADQPSPNLLSQQPFPTAPNQVWVGDI